MTDPPEVRLQQLRAGFADQLGRRLETIARGWRAVPVGQESAAELRHALRVVADVDPDVILVDLHMPTCSGAELAAVLRQEGAGLAVPIVFLSAETDPEIQQRAMSMGGGRGEAAGRRDDLPRDKQRRMLPPAPRLAGYDFEVLYQPCTEVGGDFCTDGLLEAADPAGEMFGPERLEEILLGVDPLTPAAVARSVHRTVSAFNPEAPLEDDLTFVLFRREPGSPWA